VKGKHPLIGDTTTTSINPPDPTGNVALSRIGGKNRGVDDNEMRDRERDVLGRADLERSRVARGVARRQSMPNGEWQIRSAEELRGAVARFLNPPGADALSVVYGADEIQRHIIQRARDLQMAGTLPINWGVAQEDRALKVMLESIDIVNDDDMVLTADELIQASRFFSARQRRKYASQGVALPDGSFPIPDKDSVRRAVRSVGRGGSYTRAKRHIVKRAKALGAIANLPEGWVTAEDLAIDNSLTATSQRHGEKFVTAEALHSILVLDGSENAPFPLILEDKTTESGGFARIKVPFYVGDSISKAPGFDRKILFPTALLPAIVAEAKTQISDGRQPLTVYPRHKTALDGSDLPIGGIVDLVQDGRVGSVIIDVVNKGKGEQAIALMKHKGSDGRPQPLLNAISLRSGPGRFEMESITMEDGNPDVLKVTKLLLDGVDFAPDSPAMKTYGIEFLAAESRTNDNSLEEDTGSNSMTLTLESLKTQHRTLVEEIEAPFHDKIAELTQEISVLNTRIGGYEQREAQRELKEYFQMVVDGLPGDLKDERRAVLAEIMNDCRTKAEFNDRVMPIILLGLDHNRKPVETKEERLRKLFSVETGKGQPGAAVTAETVPADDGSLDDGMERIGPLEIPSTSGPS
jgi:hypothetical protein